ncbi:esterase-like activity of phytase family protein [Roseomonas sp. OT10]|uniref:esterase-like activity of phytase family protein n=1 Tax=Roseomonas cutis TaxID=2897332 RepID=UPI001E354F2B|nr:esterase-like activity of phytase family protein [Roseomonas sp. OT10]UFN48196.1 esterase-like activity of phytase family protein [Roseomonas sp. OT10]
MIRRRSLLALAGLAGCATQRPLSRPVPLPDGPLPEGGERVLGVLELDGSALGGDGLSGLRVEAPPDGPPRLWAIGDRGSWSTARLRLDARGVPLALEEARTGRLHDTHGQELRPMYQADAESLARLPGGGWLVGFERWHRIWRYRDLDGPAEATGPLPGLEEAPLNGGLESLAVLADGRWLALAEWLPVAGDPGLRAGWLGRPGDWLRLSYRPQPGFDPSDACALPDGGALVLERRFAWTEGLSGRLAHVPAAALAAARPGSVLEGRTVMRLVPPLPTDNWEGVGVFRHRDRLLAAIVSDDNANPIQRSLLMVVSLDGLGG